MDAKDEKIIKLIGRQGKATGKQLTASLKMTRQALNKRLALLIESGKVMKIGSRKNAVYHPAHAKTKHSELNLVRNLAGLQEDAVFNEFLLKMNLKNSLGKKVLGIIRFAFTEMLNNAIDHSRSEKCSIRFGMTPYHCHFTIRDYGIGIFASIAGKFALKDENEALQDLLKGKTTTMKERHSGEGVFFTSRISDHFVVRSHKIMYSYDRMKNEPTVGQIRSLVGTEIFFQIRINTKRQLEQVFREFAPEEYDYRFEKTNVIVRLFQKELVSRSEAKRLLAGLDRFREVHLDFSGVQSIAQGFADEVFRVFQKENPNIKIFPEKANPSIQTMIRHVVDK